MTQHPAPGTQHSCDYCGLPFSGPGYSPDGARRFCCYGCYLIQRIVSARGEEGIASWILIRLGIGGFLSMNVMMISLVLYTNATHDLGASVVRGLHWALMVFSTPAMLILGAPFLLAAAKGLRSGRLNTDVLIATGSVSAYGVSAFHVIANSGHVYFDTATMLLLVVTLGRLLEATSKSRASQSIRDLMDLAPASARVMRQGREIEVRSAEVRRGDVMIVRPGERIAADGRIISGECIVEESAFTGEAPPRPCATGDSVFGGSINLDGLILVKAAAVGANALLGQIHRMLREAQSRRSPSERLAERAAGAFVPVVWTLAALAAAYWGPVRGDYERAALSSLAVLVAACPCALGIATPMATCLAIGRAARAGVLVRSGEILERLPGIRTVFFDKTGTLTANEATLASISTTGSVREDDALAWSASLAAASAHVVSTAISAAARDRGIRLGAVTDFRSLPGKGITGAVTRNGNTKRVTVGTLKLLAEAHDLPDALRLPEDSLTVSYVGWDGKVQAAMLLEDRARAEADSAIKRLRSAGIRTCIVSGDREAPARRLAEELGIEEVLSEQGPSDKIAAIRSARAAYGEVAMVGDGINDAPALAESDVGIAVGGGSDLAREASDVTLLGDDLMRIPWLLDLSRATYRIIRQNLWWAFGYNSAAIALAVLGYIHPLIAATAMVASSLAVVTNSWRITRCTPGPISSPCPARSDATESARRES